MSVYILYILEVNKMSVIFDRYELLEFFESEPNDANDVETVSLVYRITDIDKRSLFLTIWIYDEKCCLNLKVNNKTVFTASVKEVASICHTQGGLMINANNTMNIFMFKEPQLYVAVE